MILGGIVPAVVPSHGKATLMASPLPDEVCARDTYLQFSRDSRVAQPGDEIVSFTTMLRWLRGGEESPVPLYVTRVSHHRDRDGRLWITYHGRLADGSEEDTITVSGARPVWFASDPDFDRDPNFGAVNEHETGWTGR